MYAAALFFIITVMPHQLVHQQDATDTVKGLLFFIYAFFIPFDLHQQDEKGYDFSYMQFLSHIF